MLFKVMGRMRHALRSSTYRPAQFAVVVVFLLVVHGLSVEPAAAQDTSVRAFYTDFNNGVPIEFMSSDPLARSLAGVEGYAAYGFSGSFIWNRTGGEQDNGSPPGKPTVLELHNLPPHKSIDLNFLLGVIDTWDGNFNSCGPDCGVAPDQFNVIIDGDSILSTTFEHVLGQPQYQDYVPPPGVQIVRNVPFFSRNIGFDGDSAYNMGNDGRFDAIPHTGPDLRIEWFANGAGWQGGSDESWAIDNVEVIINGIDCLDILRDSVHPTIDGAAMTAIFQPKVGDFPVALSKAAELCNVHHFNWLQWVTKDTDPGRPKDKINGVQPSVPYIDPPLGGWEYPSADDFRLGYWDEEVDNTNVSLNTNTHDDEYLHFHDSPALSTLASENDAIDFLTTVVGVTESGHVRLAGTDVFKWRVTSKGVDLIGLRDHQDSSGIVDPGVELLGIFPISQLSPADRAFLVEQGVVIPEPTTLALICGAVMFGYFRRRRSWDFTMHSSHARTKVG